MSQRAEPFTVQDKTLTVRIAEMGVVRGGPGRNGVERRSGVDRRAAAVSTGDPRAGEDRRAHPDRRRGGEQGVGQGSVGQGSADRGPAGPSILKTTLGSCVGVILSDPVSGVHGMAHVMLPERRGSDRATGKYADTAVPALVAEMEHAGSARPNMEAFLVGGASMFQPTEGSGLPRIGEKNVETVLRVLGELGIRVVFQDTGGTAGRTVTFDCADRVPRVKTLNGVSQA